MAFSMETDEDAAFKVPALIPQDLQLIQDIIGDFQPPLQAKPPVASAPQFSLPGVKPPRKVVEDKADDIDSSGDDTDSEREVEDDILAVVDEDEDGDAQQKPPYVLQLWA